MGKVTDYIISLLKKQVEQHHMVVWFDPERQYEEMAANLCLPGIAVFRYTDSFFALRHEVDPLIAGSEPPSCIIYVPLAEEKTSDALVTYTAFGSVLKPGQNPWQKNTRLSVIARNALKNELDEKALCAIEKQVEQGQLRIEDLDNLKDKAPGTPDVITVIFKSSNVHDIVLGFLNSAAYDEDIIKKNAVSDLCQTVEGFIGISLPSEKSLPDIREKMARVVLTTSFLMELNGERPSALSSVKIPVEKNHREECVTVTRKWMMRSDLCKSFAVWAQKIDNELALHTIPFSFEQMASVELFPSFEKRLLSLVEERMLQGVGDDLISLAESHESTFWSVADGEIVTRWRLIIMAGRLLIELDRISADMKRAQLNVRDMIERYTSGERPWCIIDTLYRNLGCSYLHYEGIGGCESLGRLVQAASSRYMEVGGDLAELFVKSLKKEKYEIRDIIHQREVYQKFVQSGLSSEKTAYILVDALRYEMGLELYKALRGAFNVNLSPLCAEVPTVTEIGMASLLPDTEGAIITATDKGKLGLKTDDALLRDRPSRIAYMKKKCTVPFVDLTLDELLMINRSKKKIKEKVDAASLILVSTTEIDTLCETGKISLAQSSMEKVFTELRNLINILASLGVKKIVVTADHGYLMGEELDNDMKIEPPGGETLFLHRRVWVGRGGTSSPSYIRCKASDLGFGGDLEIAVPCGFGVFKAPGGDLAYFHGGISLQELITPLIVITPEIREESNFTADISWTLKPGSKKVTTRFFSVQVQGIPATLFEFVAPSVRAEMRAGDEILSSSVSATYGFDKDTKDVELRIMTSEKGKQIEPNTIMLQIIRDSSNKNVSVHLMDALSGRELARLENIEWAILQ